MTELYPFKNHPFRVVDGGERMMDNAESIKEYGVLVTAVARTREGGAMNWCDTAESAAVSLPDLLPCPLSSIWI